MSMKNKIFGLLIFVILLTGIIYLILISSNRNSNQNIKKIDIIGYDLLSDNDYKDYLKINSKNYFVRNDIKNIRENLLKHPYIKNVDIEYHPDNTVTIFIKEKEIKTLLLKDNKTFLISYEMNNSISYSIIPLLKNTKALDLPIITNLKISEDAIINQNKKNLKKNKKIVDSYKIITVIDEIDIDMAKNLSEINFDNDNVQLIFNNLKPIVILEEKKIVKNLIALNEILINNELKNAFLEAKYIDFRYENYVFIGNNESIKI
ncbi:MAG: FtsQ-type POTRA domain-containing protein [Ignavibacterium sp.]